MPGKRVAPAKGGVTLEASGELSPNGGEEVRTTLSLALGGGQ